MVKFVRDENLAKESLIEGHIEISNIERGKIRLGRINQHLNNTANT